MEEQMVLSIENICKSYPGVKALDNVSIDFAKGEVHAIVGENGAGKSTLMKIISGAIAPDSGTIMINGKKHKAMEPQFAKENGVEVIYQEFTLVPSLSAADNVFLGEKKFGAFVVDDHARRKRAAEIFKQLKVNIDPTKPVRDLSPAYQQIVEIAKAVSREVKVLIMDEPTAPLTVSEVDMLFDIVRDLKSKGVTIIYISHRLEELFEIADKVTIMRDGTYIDTKNISDTSRRELVSLMAGRDLIESYPERSKDIGGEALRVEHLSGNGVENINFSLHKGEILGFAGLVGAGRSELMQLIYGAARCTHGKIFLNGKEEKIKSPGDAIAKGIGLIPEDRKKSGAFLSMSIQWNTVINSIKSISRFGVVDTKKELELSQYYKNKFQIKAPTLLTHVGTLSGGNQQKVVIAKTMAAQTQVIIFDEPTRGIDVQAKQEIYKLMNELASSGIAIIIVSSEMPELIGMSDRIVVIAEGKQTGILSKEEFDQTKILDLASGGEQHAS
ncbi:sugar ABC transporter ATP-binding protein [Paenibacillus andongensis]|uniref:sugar ABC transporter ATP-binding protein n=1 Tax=Paenibacillus andongensis TaxID=2975482 RepID=UPI0021BB8D98|nr:sugar ABC transporter ATP-binding protein [Paenibacillus andongensis]